MTVVHCRWIAGGKTGTWQSVTGLALDRKRN